MTSLARSGPARIHAADCGCGACGHHAVLAGLRRRRLALSTRLSLCAAAFAFAAVPGRWLVTLFL